MEAILKQATKQNLEPKFLKQLKKYYKNKLSFDALIHSVHHVRSILSKDESNDGNSKDLMKEFLKSVQPNDTNLVFFPDGSSTYIWNENTMVVDYDLSELFLRPRNQLTELTFFLKIKLIFLLIYSIFSIFNLLGSIIVQRLDLNI